MLTNDAKVVIVTRQTRMQALRKQYATPGQARFVMSKNRAMEFAKDKRDLSQDVLEEVFEELSSEQDVYLSAVGTVQQSLDLSDVGLAVQTIDRQYLPNFVFGPRDIVVTLGQDGLVANTAKYAKDLPIIAVNPDPAAIDGVLLPFRIADARDAVMMVLREQAKYRHITMAEAKLTDGQRLLAFNDLFIGVRTHTSARYRITYGKQSETQSSSGIIVSTGVGSSGWMSSIINMVRGIDQSLGLASPKHDAMRLKWDENRILYCVREPFVSKTSKAHMVAGTISGGSELVIESLMGADGVIFSDGIESDYLEFNSGTTARIGIARNKVRLVIP